MSAGRLPTFLPNQLTGALDLPKLAVAATVLLLPSLFVIDTHFTIPRRVEGYVELGDSHL